MSERRPAGKMHNRGRAYCSPTSRLASIRFYPESQTNGFSKKLENIQAAVALDFAHYNLVRLHKTLRVTPARAGERDGSGMVARGIGAKDVEMRRIGDTIPYRGIEFGIDSNGPGELLWHFHPKIGHGDAQRGTIRGTRKEAIAACKAAIDQWLGPKNSN